MPLGIGRFLGRNAGLIGGAIGTVVGGGPLGGTIGGAIGSALQSERRAGAMTAPSFSADDYDPMRGLGVGQMVTQQQGRNLEAEALSQVMPTAIGTAGYLQSAAMQGAGRAAARLAMENTEREQQRLASQALQGRVGLEQQQQQTIQNLIGMQAQGRQFGMQQAFAERQAEREFQQSRSDAALGLAATLLTSPLKDTALGKVMGKGRPNFRQFGSRLLDSIRGGGQGGGSNTTTRPITYQDFVWEGNPIDPQDPYGQYQRSSDNPGV